MDYEEARRRILYHANLREPGGEGWLSLLYALSEAEGKDAIPNMGQHTNNLVACLEVVNRRWNGTVPSQRADGMGQAVDAPIAHAMAAILADGVEHIAIGLKGFRRSHADLECLSEDLWCVAAAWTAVLAGDVDMLSEHLAEAGWANGVTDVSRWRSAARPRQSEV